MKLTFHGGAQSVTGANYLLEIGKRKILVECGMFQGGRHAEEDNFHDFPFNPREVDTLIVTHAHIDHTGRIPKLVNDGFRGKIYGTPATLDLAKLMLEDSGWD